MKLLVYIFSTLIVFVIGEFNKLVVGSEENSFWESIMDKSLALFISLVGIYFAARFILRLLRLIMKKYEDQIESLKREVKRKNDEIERLKNQLKQ